MLRRWIESWFGRAPEDPVLTLAKWLVARSPPSSRDGVYSAEQAEVIAAARTHEDLERALVRASGTFRADLLALQGDLAWKEARYADALESWQLASALLPTDLALLANQAEAQARLGLRAELAETARTWEQLGGDPGDPKVFAGLVAAVAGSAGPAPTGPGVRPAPKGRRTLR